MLTNLEPGLYQQTILATCTEKNTLVVLPTGMGKSIIFVMLVANRLTHFPRSKVLIVAPTKPLCQQHVTTLQRFLDRDDIVLFTGEVKPELREKMFEANSIIVSTPQGLENDIINKKIPLKDVSLLVVDECHRAVKEYSYVWLAKHYVQTASYPRILGLTASPGNDEVVIKEVCKNLFIEAIEVRTEDEPDVSPYIQEVKQQYINVELTPELEKIRQYYELLLKDRSNQLASLGTLPKRIYKPSRKELLGVAAQLQGRLARGEKTFDVLRSLSLVAEIMKVYHAQELLETQGLTALQEYIDKMQEDARKGTTKAVKNIVADLNFRSASILVKSLLEQNIEHPKFTKLKELLQEITAKNKVIVFNQYRDNAGKIVEQLNQLPNIKAKLFIGQAKKKGLGLSQKEQHTLLESFSAGEFNVIVMTSVGEEGLDIPAVDKVIFFEPVPSAIRHIQRRGRTGRLSKGEVIVLLAKGTRDEASRWSAHHKESKMLSLLKVLRKELHLEPAQQTLQSFEKDIKIYADHREKAGRIVRILLDKGVDVEMKQLEVADYILSDSVGVELKTVPDFINSLVDGRLLEQIKDLKYNFKRPLLVLQGEEDLYSVRNIHPNAIRGMLATIAVTFGVPILTTRDNNDTMELLLAIAKKEQSEGSSFSPNPTKRATSLQEKQEFFIGSLPETGLKTAQALLKHFKNPKNVVTATDEALQDVEGVGKEKAASLRKLFDSEY